MSDLRLYTYYRSSTAYRVRVALNLKGLHYEAIPVHLLREEHHNAAHAARNPVACHPRVSGRTPARPSPLARAGGAERMLAKEPARGRGCLGDAPTPADCCVIPQMFNAQRIGCDFARLPILQAIYAHCLSPEPFQRAAPAAQPDAE